MFAHKNVYPKYERKVAYADLTNSGKGILQQYVYNALVSDGKLRAARKLYEFDKVYPPIYGLATLPREDNIIVESDDGLYIWRPSISYTKIVDGYFPTPSFAYLASSQTLVIASRRSPIYVYKNGVATQVFDQRISDLEIFRDRCFGVWQNTLYYTEQGDVAKWTGRIDLPFSANALAATDDGLYVLGQDAYLLRFDDNEPDSKLIPVYRNFGSYFVKSIESVGKGFMFAHSGGVAYFNGSSVKNVLSVDIASHSFLNECGAVFRGKYYLTYRKPGKNKNENLLVVDIATMKLETVYNIPATYLYASDTDLFIVDGEKAYNLFVDAAVVTWQSRPYNFGSDSTKKSLDALLVNTSTNLTITLRTESETRIFKIEGKKKLQKIPLHGSFYNLTLTVETDGMEPEIGFVGVAANVYKQGVN